MLSCHFCYRFLYTVCLQMYFILFGAKATKEGREGSFTILCYSQLTHGSSSMLTRLASTPPNFLLLMLSLCLLTHNSNHSASYTDGGGGGASAHGIVTPHTCTRGKASVLSVCCLSVRQHTNRQIWTSRHASRKYHRSIKIVKKIGFIVLRIVWQGPRASQTLYLCWPRLSTLPTAGHVLSAHVHNSV